MHLHRQALLDSIKNAWLGLRGRRQLLHPRQKAFVEAFKAWDGEAMADALVGIVQELGGFECSAETKTNIAWSCRELLDSMELHPLTGTLIFVPEGPLTLVLDGKVEGSSTAAPAKYPTVTLKLALSALEPGSLKRRWRKLGLVDDVVALDRDEVRTPAPLKGEPDFPGYQPGKRSIHRRRGSLIAPTRQTYAHALASEARGPKVYLERYLAGDRERVWTELLALGASVRDDSILPDALSVARETMRRCRQNVERLAELLHTLGYVFQSPSEVFVPPEADVMDRIADLENRVGPIPLSLCAWYETVGSANFMGSHPNWPAALTEAYENPHAIIDEGSICAYPDPLVISPARQTLAYDEANWYRESYWLDLGPDEFHKEDMSGGAPYAIKLPNPAADGPFANERHGTTFVDYIRACFRWGGFPGWDRLVEDPARTILLRELTKDLLFI